jgi:hypothetical protein
MYLPPTFSTTQAQRALPSPRQRRCPGPRAVAARARRQAVAHGPRAAARRRRKRAPIEGCPASERASEYKSKRASEQLVWSERVHVQSARVAARRRRAAPRLQVVVASSAALPLIRARQAAGTCARALRVAAPPLDQMARLSADRPHVLVLAACSAPCLLRRRQRAAGQAAAGADTAVRQAALEQTGASAALVARTKQVRDSELRRPRAC